ncbi:outer membrane beta-barrel family protein [Paracrocinitomix mangrovi]|uniref:outer membrane beta-barrel family protein n=1 Tax=Paracrocinitomix mangrovi TaxID=2862509 RepID=UPI001C8D604A|nr:outer membrane beta-barrel family protein [Paracrocinitomix mangrovi]UKN02768.1 outer membrane beta-barrel family protein [Paracrocinitomix mangrovi]
MKKLTLQFFIGFVIICCSVANTFSQTTFTIKANVVDSVGVPIEFGNFILLNPNDSTIIKGVDVWEGKVELKGVADKEVLIKVTAYAHDAYYLKTTLIPDENNIVELEQIKLSTKSTDLNIVEVVYRKPPFERAPGKLIVNVEESMLADRGTVRDLLRSTPNVIVKSNDEVIVVGKGPAIIYLDGQRIISLDMLSSLSSNDVSRIEVIENPSARYDAEGNAVIEIITVKGTYNGYEGSLGLRGMKRTEEQAAYWGRFRYRKDWFSTYIGAGQYTGRLHEEESYYRTIKSNPVIDLENDVLRVTDHRFDSWVWVDNDFRIDSANTIFLNYSFSREKFIVDVDNSNKVYEDSVYQGLISSTTVNVPKRFSHSVSTGYVHTIDSLGSDFRIAGQYTNFNFSGEGDIWQQTDFNSTQSNRYKSTSSSGIEVFMAQADLLKKFNDKVSFAAGIKNSYVTNNSGIDFQAETTNGWITDSSYYNKFDYHENVAGAYSELSGSLKKLDYQIGLRYEWTITKGDSYVGGVGVIDRDYHNVFPNIQLDYNFTPDLVLGASYTNRIQRPKFQDLDPFIEYIDSLTSFRGNPNLLPAVSHNAQLSLIYMEYASISFSYTKSFNPIYLSVVQNPGTNTFSAIEDNVKSAELYNIGIVLPYELSWWTTFNSFSYTFNSFEIEDDAQIVVNTKPTLYVSLWNEFRIPKICDIEISYEYTVPGAQGFFSLQPMHYFYAGVSRKFFNKALSVRFNVFDIFKQYVERGESAMPAFDVSYRSWQDTRSFMLTLEWSFGKLRDRSMSGIVIDESEKERLED